MKIEKKLISAALVLVSCSFIFAQNNQQVKRSETTVEDEYLSDADDSSNLSDIILTELADSDDYDNKLVALQMCEDSINEGKTSVEMVNALHSLAGEGIKKQVRQNNRLMNNYPEVRARACTLLGEIPTEESKAALYDIAKEDKEPMVVSAAVRSLGKIGLNDNDDVVSMIIYVERKFAHTNPTSSLAYDVLNAYEQLAPTVKDKKAMIQSITAIAADGNYAVPVRKRALNLLKTLQSGK